MSHIVKMYDKESGKLVREIEVQVSDHPAKGYQSLIAWDGITKIGVGDSERAACQDALDQFSKVLGDYEMVLTTIAK